MTAPRIYGSIRLLLIVMLCLISFEIGRLYQGSSKTQQHIEKNVESYFRRRLHDDKENILKRPAVQHNGRKIYIDIGANNGESFVECSKFGIPGMCKDGTWDISAVEANPAYNTILYEKRMSMLDKNLVSSFQLYNGTVLDTTGRANVNFAIDRSPAGHASSLSSDALLFRNKVDNNKDRDIINLPTITMHQIFEDASIQQRDFVVVKIDVEGFEYDLLPYLIIHGLLHRIDVLAVEYHDTNIWFYKGLSEERQSELHEQTKCLKWIVSKADRVKQYINWE